MLVIKIEVWPGGNPDRAKEIGRVGMANVSSLREDSDYIYMAVDDRGNQTEGQIRGHKRSAGFWQLALETIRQIMGGGSDLDEKHEETLELVAHRMQEEDTSKPLKF